MVLKTLEFKDCALDDPEFRQNLQEHEKELERTNRDIKQLIKECSDVITTSLTLSRLQKQLAKHLVEFNFETIGGSQTDDEISISQSLKEFGRLLCDIEEERSKILDTAMDQYIKPLEDFRRLQIGNVKTEKKKFDKESTKFYQSQEKHLSMSCKKDDNFLKEADADLQLQRRHFIQASLRYVKAIQEVHERKKFEFVETLWSFMNSWMNFFRISYDVTREYEPYMKDLQVRVQKTRDSFISFCAEAEALMNKIKTSESAGEPTTAPTTGFVYLMEKKAFATQWCKNYCTYDKATKQLTLVPFSHHAGKATASPEVYTLKSCCRRSTESIDKRFCFDLIVEGSANTMTFQALSEADRMRWLYVMDGKEPIYEQPGKQVPQKDTEFTTALDDTGFRFVTACIEIVEKRGINEQGLYRIGGVNSKATRLLQDFMEGSDKMNLNDETEWELRTVTSALKAYFRFLPEPLLTFRLHKPLIEAAKKENKADRLLDVHYWIHALPERRERRMLEILIRHLAKIAANSSRNLMNISNLGVCFGPTLLRPKEESVAALVDIKFCNIIVEILIEHWQKIFCTTPAPIKVKDRPDPFLPSSGKPPTLSKYSGAVASGGSHPSSPRSRAPLEEKNTPGWVPETAPAPVSISYTHYQSVPEDTSKPVNPNITFLPSMKASHSAAPTGSSPNNGSNHHHHNHSQSVYYSTPLEQPPGSVNGVHHSRDNSAVVLREHPLSPSGLVATRIARLSTALPYPGSLTHGYPARSTAQAAMSVSTSNLTGGGGEKNMTTLQTARPFVPVKENTPPAGGSSSTASSTSRSNGTASAVAAPVSSKPQTGGGKPSRATILPVSFTQQAVLPDGLAKASLRSSASLTPTMSPNSSRLSMLSDQTASRRRVRTLYQCHADVPSELSFEPNEIITSIRQSIEPGWLYGELRGKTGLVPENYVEELPQET
ncbi:Rho GTPase-activating protein 42 [Hypsibius exemplaris]|uniref:Rho GTPase-activating protein 42 n=1 Tax=Hypsibius exemplaris TaxID=2072580 RepID=A0A1W0WHI7_HYPEX|nr:Rho GTPase-activating protein 42 [Hypsibius exemplaris]